MPMFQRHCSKSMWLIKQIESAQSHAIQKTADSKRRKTMKKMLLLMAVVIAAMAMTSCVSVHSNDAGDLIIHPKTTGPVDTYRPLFKVDDKTQVTASSDVQNLFFIFTWGSDNKFAEDVNAGTGIGGILAKVFPFMNAKETAMKAAYYKACKDANCDSIVGAKYEVTMKDYFFYKKLKVEIKGYPAVQTGLETIEPKQYYIDENGKIVFLDKLINAIPINSCNSLTDPAGQTTKKKFFGIPLPF